MLLCDETGLYCVRGVAMIKRVSGILRGLAGSG
jgi:hypothetical protein